MISLIYLDLSKAYLRGAPFSLKKSWKESYNLDFWAILDYLAGSLIAEIQLFTFFSEKSRKNTYFDYFFCIFWYLCRFFWSEFPIGCFFPKKSQKNVEKTPIFEKNTWEIRLWNSPPPVSCFGNTFFNCIPLKLSLVTYYSY